MNTEEIEALKIELEQTRAKLREYELWTPLRDLAIKSGLDPADWELARFDLSEQQRFELDELNHIVVLENGRPSDISPARFFAEVYRAQRPQLYTEPQTAKADNRKTLKRSAFDQMAPGEKMAWVKAGGSVTD